jgi:hypothetical protein
LRVIDKAKHIPMRQSPFFSWRLGSKNGVNPQSASCANFGGNQQEPWGQMEWPFELTAVEADVQLSGMIN